VPREPFSFGGMARSKFGDMDITGEAGLVVVVVVVAVALLLLLLLLLWWW
jgi:hypothetical protein